MYKVAMKKRRNIKQFEKVLDSSIGRNRLEIQNLMGEFEGKSLDSGNGYLWDYRRPILDEATGEIFG